MLTCTRPRPAPCETTAEERTTRLRACPFCGAPAVREAHPSLADAVRIACGDEACGVRPRTEYLLAEFAAELEAAWNRRPTG